MTIPDLSKPTWKQRLRLFIFNRQEFMPFTFWHLLVYIGGGGMFAWCVWLFLNANGYAEFKIVLLCTYMGLLAMVISAHQFWQRFYATCIKRQQKKSLCYTLYYLLHGHIITFPFVATNIILISLFVRDFKFTFLSIEDFASLVQSFFMIYVFGFAFSVGIAWISIPLIFLISTLLYFFISRKRN